ncbi:LysR family transcriptional regulator [Sphingomonas melonis]|jgi:DNA-binding transcriptional LysR family regulator|uniref:DNA-binding transcriptional LysR family regulator n=1 Tax=Sphingomonas melonis TaxID=152682 RepID=A0A7Y9FQ57_9SPHN|nr:LysR family transcriptional regulator [Sphingomonas melonis]NYD91012.1 DNA-binding transcriptional LysR family regulator [Sphingomonas melonis]
MLDLADLAVLIEAVQEGSLSGAGRRLGLTPVAASRRLAVLEAEVGARLVHRTTRSLSLTPEGEAFLPHAEAILAHAEDGRAAVSGGDEEAGGLLRVAASVPFGRKILTPMLVGFLNEHQRLKVELLLSDAVADLAAQGIDVAVRFGELKDSTLVARRLANNARGLYAAPAYLASHPAPTRVVELREHDCLAVPAARQWSFEHKGRAVRQTVAGRFAADSMEALHEAALRGLGIVQLSEWNVRDDVAAGRLTEIRLADGAVPDQGIWAVLPTRRLVPRKVHLFLEALSRHLSTPAN